MKRWAVLLAVGGLFLGALGPFAADAVRADDERGWKRIYEEDGITVSTRDEPGHDMPSFRGETTLRAGLLHLLSILVDDTRSKEWAKGVDEGYVLRALNPRAWIVYSFSHQVWPVQNRDLVMRRTVEVVKPGEVLRVRLVCIPGEKPARSGTIRVKSCETSFVLRKLDEATTAIDYRVRADPGGNSPTWIARLASKSIPLDTLTALEKQVKRTKGQYAPEIKHWGEELAKAATPAP
ncbi:MAG TPA: START domain-containing protein [Polyangiales bacterium]